MVSIFFLLLIFKGVSKPSPQTGAVVDFSFWVFIQKPGLPVLDLLLEVKGGKVNQKVSYEGEVSFKVEGVVGDGFEEAEVLALLFRKFT